MFYMQLLWPAGLWCVSYDIYSQMVHGEFLRPVTDDQMKAHTG